MQQLNSDHVLDGTSIPSARGGKKRKSSSGNADNSEYLTAMNDTNKQMATLNITYLASKITELGEKVMIAEEKVWQMGQDGAPPHLITRRETYLEQLRAQLNDAKQRHTNLKANYASQFDGGSWDPNNPGENDMAPRQDEE